MNVNDLERVVSSDEEKPVLEVVNNEIEVVDAETVRQYQPLLRKELPNQKDYWGTELRFDSDLGRCL